MIEKLSKIWAGSIAYVMLLVGGGLSVAGNVADVYRTRGAAVDTLDIVLAGAWPVLVILTIEGFVSRRWSPRPGFQVLRWVGCLFVGSMAMMSSWVHLHDLMASRGQIVAVAIGGPLAIDGMAIMATGLLLSTRGILATAKVALGLGAAVDSMITGQDREWMDDVERGHKQASGLGDTADNLFARLEREMGTEGTPAIPVPVSAPPRSNEVKPESVPGEVAALIYAWQTAGPERPTLKDMTEILAAETGRSTRTVRRWRDALLKG